MRVVTSQQNQILKNWKVEIADVQYLVRKVREFQ